MLQSTENEKKVTTDIATAKGKKMRKGRSDMEHDTTDMAYSVGIKGGKSKKMKGMKKGAKGKKKGKC